MRDRAGGFRAAHHAEVRLEPIEPCKEDNAGFVVLRRRREDMPGERHGGLEELMIPRNVTGFERGKRQRRGWSDSIEYAEERVAVAVLVAKNQAVIVEVVSGVHANACG